MFVAIIAFFSRISDSRFGGTYITFLNTVTNLGTAWSSTAALGMIDILTFQKCSIDPDNGCSTVDLKEVRSIHNTSWLKKKKKKWFSHNTNLSFQTFFSLFLSIVWFVSVANIILPGFLHIVFLDYNIMVSIWCNHVVLPSSQVKINLKSA